MYADDTYVVSYGDNIAIAIENQTKKYSIKAQKWVTNNHLKCNNKKTTFIRFNYTNNRTDSSLIIIQ